MNSHAQKMQDLTGRQAAPMATPTDLHAAAGS